MKHYKEFLVSAEPFNSDILSSILWELDIEGINEEVNCLKVFADENNPISKKDIEEKLNLLKDNKLLFNYNVEENFLESKNWNKEWEENLNIINVTDKITIKPTFKEYTPKTKDEIIIEIDPKMSFGTGEHQTTKLMLEYIQKYVKQNDYVLDAGSGTGVLAIGAIKLGASKAVAFDIDEWCLENGKENVKLNNVEDKIDVILGEIKDVKQNNFDLVIANIQKNILINIKSDLVAKLKAGGHLLLSGLLYLDEKDIIKEFTEAGLKFVEKKQMDDWLAVIFQK